MPDCSPEQVNDLIELIGVSDLAALHEELDGLTNLLTGVFGVPVSACSVVGDETVYRIGSNDGTHGTAERSLTACRLPVELQRAVIVEDIAEDPRLRELPGVKKFGLRFYAGVEILNERGEAVGALCLKDTKPRRFDEDQRQLLSQFGKLASEMLGRAVQRERVAREFASHREILELFVQHTPAAIAMFDNDMRCIIASRRWKEDYKVGDQDVIGRTHYEVFPDIPERWKEDHRRCLAGEHLSSEADYFDREGGVRVCVRWDLKPWHHGDGSIGGLIMFTEVVTDRVEAAARLEESEHRLELALKAAGLGMWDWNVTTGETIFNDIWFTMLGYEPFELPATLQTSEELTHPEDLKRSYEAVEKHFAGETALYECEMRMRGKDGSWIWIRDVGRVNERADDGSPLRMVGLHMDITTAREREEALKRFAEDLIETKDQLEQQAVKLAVKNDELEAARKLAEDASRSKSSFLANMSHEIRTPMTAIMGFIDVLGDDGLDEDVSRHALQTIRRNTEHLLTVINDILDFSKVEAGRLEIERVPQRTGELFDDLRDLFSNAASQKSIELSVEVDQTVPDVVQTDPVRLRQILTNLLSNAVKFTQEGGVTLRASYVASDESLVCEVIDTGIGMTEEQAAKLFSAFSQADASTTREFGGSGLGLVISAKMAELLGGSVKIASTEAGVGTVMRVCVHAPPVDDVRTEAEASGRAAESRGVRVLVAEDGVDNQRLIQHFLTTAGAEVRLVVNGQEAVDAIEADPDAFDLVLMDMQMPVMDGYTAARTLRERGQTLPIVALTAHAMASDREKCLQAGCDDHVAKPIDRERLIEVCRDWGRRERTLRCAG